MGDPARAYPRDVVSPPPTPEAELRRILEAQAVELGWWKEATKFADATEVASAVAEARRAFDEGGWRWTKGSLRAVALLKLADILEQRSRPISELIAREMGKPIRVNMAREVEAENASPDLERVFRKVVEQPKGFPPKPSARRSHRKVVPAKQS